MNGGTVLLLGVAKTQTSKTQTSDPEKLRAPKNSDPPGGVSETQTMAFYLFATKELHKRR